MSRKGNNNFQMNNNNKDIPKKSNIFASFNYIDNSESDNESDKEQTVQTVQTQQNEQPSQSQQIQENKPKLFELKPVENPNDEATNELWTKVKTAPKYKPSIKVNIEKKEFSENKQIKVNRHREDKVKEIIEQQIQQSHSQSKEEEIEEEDDEEVEDGSEIKLMNKWYVWVHETDSKDWSPQSFKIAHTIDNISNFWKFFNNISKLDHWKYNFFIMKENSHPTWEHSSNRNGGTCSFRIDVGQCIDVIEQLSMLVLNESISDENDLNGISFAAKGNWSVIKIWNRDNKNNISNHMPSYMRKIYPSISIKYKENTPEY